MNGNRAIPARRLHEVDAEVMEEVWRQRSAQGRQGLRLHAIAAAPACLARWLFRADAGRRVPGSVIAA